MQERTLNGAQAGENTDIFTTRQIFERFWKIGSWLTDSEPNNEPNFSIMHIFYNFSFKTKTSDMKQVKMRRNSWDFVFNRWLTGVWQEKRSWQDQKEGSYR